MGRKRRGKVDRELVRRALAHAKKLSEDMSGKIGNDLDGSAFIESASASATAAKGACFITVGGHTGCDSPITEKGCEFAAAKRGGIATWIPNGSCN